MSFTSERPWSGIAHREEKYKNQRYPNPEAQKALSTTISRECGSVFIAETERVGVLQNNRNSAQPK